MTMTVYIIGGWKADESFLRGKIDSTEAQISRFFGVEAAAAAAALRVWD